MPDQEITRENIPEKIAELSQIISQTIETVNQYPPETREQQIFDQWTLKDILAHFSGWNWLTIRDLGKLQRGEEITEWLSNDEDLDEFNQKEVESRKNRSWEEVYVEFVDSCNQLILEYKGLKPEHWKKQFGPEQDSTPVRSLLIDIDHMGNVHLPELKDVVTRITQSQ